MAELEFTAKIATRVPDRLPVFAMKRPVANRRVLIELAASLGLPPFSKGSELTSRETWLSLQDGPYVLAMNSRSGAWRATTAPAMTPINTGSHHVRMISISTAPRA